MKTCVMGCVKKSKILYGLYYYAGSFGVNLLKLFLKSDDKLILFVSFGGRHFNDSPRIIYEAMKKDLRFNDYKTVWAFRSPENYPLPDNEKVKIDTLKYYKLALKARCWITNVMIERALNFTGKNTYYFHTTHGIFPKYCGKDVNDNSFDTKAEYKYDCSCAQCEYEARLQARMFGLRKEQILISGYPRNDKLTNHTQNDIDRIKKAFNIPENKKVILYAPTFREDHADVTSVRVNFKKWELELQETYIVLFRAHPVTRNAVNIPKDSAFVYDCSSYPDISDLYLISDLLISDYSAVFFDFVILERPMICYAYDYDQYTQTRGLYMNLCQELPGGKINEDQLIRIIKETPNKQDMNMIFNFKRNYANVYGNATRLCLDHIIDHLN